MSRLRDQLAEAQQRIATLESELQEEIRSHQEYKHCGCEFEPNTKDGYAPPKIECVYHNNIRQDRDRLQAQLNQAIELLERNGITRDDLFPPRQA